MEVIHARNIVSGDIYIARTTAHFQGSILGNPFRIGIHGTREEVVQKYRKWLWNQLQKKGKVYQEIERLTKLYEENHDLRLACWCSPKLCHGHVVIEAILWMKGNTPSERL